MGPKFRLKGTGEGSLSAASPVKFLQRLESLNLGCSKLPLSTFPQQLQPRKIVEVEKVVEVIKKVEVVREVPVEKVVEVEKEPMDPFCHEGVGYLGFTALKRRELLPSTSWVSKKGCLR